MKSASIRHDWTLQEVEALYHQPFNDLIFQAQRMHRHCFDPNLMQMSTLVSIKTGACPEDCQYCPQSGHYDTNLQPQKMMAVDAVLQEAANAKARGATRFCMGAAWKSPSDKDFPNVLAMIQGVKSLGMETCVTLGALSSLQTEALSQAGLDYYNHNLDTSAEYYPKIISTRIYQDRLDTLSRVRNAGIKVCSGGIIGMGESITDRLKLLIELANLPSHPESVPINQLVKVEGTPLADASDVDPFEFVRLIALARLMMPASYVRLSAGRENMPETLQALAFLAGANSIFYGEKLLTTPNPERDADLKLLARLGIKKQSLSVLSDGDTDLPKTTIEEGAKSILSIAKNALFYNAAN